MNTLLRTASSLLAATFVAGAMAFSAVPVSAKTVSSSVTMVSGPCETDWLTTGDQFNYPLADDNGDVSINMRMAGGVPTLVSVCADPGWTVDNKGATNGVQLTLNYAGKPAIDFKYVLGKTDIRYR